MDSPDCDESVCKDQIPDGDSVDLQHLRRFAKANLLPVYLQPPGSRGSSTDSRHSTASSSSNASKSSSRSRSRMRKRRNSAASTLHLLICPTDVISHEDLSALMMKQSPFAQDGFPLRLREITVPLLAPTSVEQAQQWTAQYWPTLYRKTNPFGPHPSLVTRSEEEIGNEAAEYMMLARQVATESSTRGFGISAGCVIVERKADRHGEIVAIAGDARLSGFNGSNASNACSGNIACHAAMRGIGMVARKRREAFEKDNLIANGYLCVELEIYMTHEPCLMCSMAIVHSRFSRCIFGQRMPASGGMAGDSGLGYGLFWRSELNWKLLCWEYSTLKGQEMAALKEDTQV
ncbi:hypothetical protein ANO11243_005610 [Dothideomycetidae sp. 11243]|nr:hypothetical protein ANO11243_005610 [fungal sp. No.11243]